MNTARDLDAAVRATGVPILGVTIVQVDDKSTWHVQFPESATDEQKAVAQAVIGAFDPTRFAFDRAKAVRLAEVDTELTRRNAAGFTHGGKVYQIDDASLGRITALAILAHVNGGADWPQGFSFVAADNSAAPFTAANFVAFAAAAAQTANARRLHARALKDQIIAAVDTQALVAIEITSGWD